MATSLPPSNQDKPTYTTLNEPAEPMKRLFRYLRPYNASLYAATANSVLNKVADLMPPLLVAWMIDTLANKMPVWMGSIFGVATVWQGAVFLAVAIVIIFGVESFFEWLYQKGFMNLAQRVQHDLRLDAYNHLQEKEIAFFEENRTGNLMAMLNDDINQLERFLNTSFSEIVQLITLFIFAAIALMDSSLQLTLIGMIPIPLILLGSLWYQRKIAPRYKRMRTSVGELSSRLENNISGITVIKSFTAEDFESQRVRAASDEYKKANFEAIKLSAAYIPLIRMLIALGFASTMLIGAYWYIHGMHGFSLGDMTLFAMMIQRILWPVTRLGRVLDEYERARASSRRVFGLIDTPHAIQDPAEPTIVKELKGTISLENVHFAYKPALPILKGINLKLSTGQTLGIAGTTGAGKTTFVKLFLRLYDVTGGSIKIDGIDIRQLPLKQLRQNIALVSQEVYLFHGTIRENIAYGMGVCTDEQVMEAAQKAQLHDFIATLPDGYASIVGERGIKLSGGQRQRLSIARAILKNAPILILDEATSSVDTETERAIQQNLNQLTKGRTALIIAHRLSTLRHADSIIVLKDGGIAEKGTHDGLLLQNGIYADLWNVQIGELGA